MEIEKGARALPRYFVDGVTGQPLNLPGLGAGASFGGSIVLGGTAQTLAPANPARRSFQLQNRSSGDLWINEVGGTAAIGGSASYQVAAGGTFSASTTSALSILGATTGQAWTATETI